MRILEVFNQHEITCNANERTSVPLDYRGALPRAIENSKTLCARMGSL